METRAPSTGGIPPTLLDAPRDPDRVLAAAVGAAVEPAVQGDDLEAGPVEQAAPVLRRRPGELHRRAVAVVVPHRQRQQPCLLVPVRALPDARLPLDPAAVRLL